MTTPILEDFFTLAVPLRAAVPNSNMIIPESQRQRGVYDSGIQVLLPAGLHTVQLLWRGSATPIHVRLLDSTPNGRNLVVLPGGADAKTVTVTFVVPPEGQRLTFIQQYVVEAGQVGTPLSTLGVNFILNPAGTQEA